MALIKHKYARRYIANDPVNALAQTVAGHCATNLDGPMSVDNRVQFQDL